MLHEEEQPNGDGTKNNETNDGRRFPGERDTAKLQTKEEHNGARYHGQGAQPVHGLQSLPKRCLRGVHIQDEEDDEEGESVERQVDVKAPSPADILRESASHDRAHTRCQRPDTANHAKICSSFSHCEQIRYGDVDEHNQASTSDTLYDACRYEHIHVDGERCDQRTNEENGVRSK